jgi:RNA polymerase sigma-70 factor (ECF subfamily)
LTRYVLDNPQLEPLLARVALQDRAAFKALYDLSASHLLGVALRILRIRSLAEEAVQDAFVQIWQNARQFQVQKAPASAWMNSIIRYRALDVLRRTGREVPIDDLGVEPVAASVPMKVGDIDLERCLAGLSDETRHCVQLAFVEGYSHPELARRTGRPLGTVKSWIRRGLQQLKECLGS